MVDSKEYSREIDAFIMQMVNIRDMEGQETRRALTGMCKLLHIGDVELTFYENMLDYKMGKGSTNTLFDDGKFDPERAVTLHDMTDVGNPVVYSFAPESGVEWDSEDLAKIQTFEKAIHVFRSRIRTMHLAEQYMFMDKDMGIYNLAYFMRQVGRLIGEKRISDYNACRFNLQRFSYVNLQVGRRKATELMRRYVQMLQSKIGDDAFVCRVGGDNFVCLYHRDQEKVVEEHMKGIHMVYDEDSGEAILISAYAGFYFIPESTQRATDVMDNVSIAAAQAKTDRMRSMVFFDERLVKMQEHKKEIEAQFPIALENEEFKVYYQPKVGLENYKMVGAEALCRWERDGKIVPPDSFIPILEQTTAVCRLDFYMLEHVCRDIRRWLDEGKELVKVSVNLSRRHLGSSHLLENIIQIINMYDIPHEYIEIELTETTTDVDFTDLKEIVFGLQKVGISTSVDDFGVGYSSMNLIRDLPWNVLKIDKSFLPEADDQNKKHFTMLKHLIAMADELGLECIVEGVETTAQVDLLKSDGCNLAQGFFFDKPLPVEVFEQRLANIDKPLV